MREAATARRSRAALWCALLLAGCGGGEGGDGGAGGEGGEGGVGGLQAGLQALLEEHEVASITAAVIRDGRLVETRAVGVADRRTDTPARPDTLYLIASCSKPVVGIAIARLLALQPDVGLDDDVNDWLAWPEPLRHPDFPDDAITLRQLATHRAGIAEDGPEDYDSYPKPDPDEPLDDYLQGLLADEAYWLDSAPGTAESYSNLGAALAGLVVEKAAGEDFSDFTRAQIFEPLGMTDTGWYYADFDEEQRARLARPHDESLEPLEHYGFNDYPSGELRTTAGDLARLLIALSTGGEPVLEAADLDVFHDVPLFIAAGDGEFDHSGGEAGVNTYFRYDLEGRGFLYFINSDLDDEALEAIDGALTALLAAHAGMAP